MTRTELNKFIQQNISEQGNASSIALTSLSIELIKHIPCTVHISNNKTESLNKTIYKITDDQNEINAIINSITKNEVSNVCVMIMVLHFIFRILKYLMI